MAGSRRLDSLTSLLADSALAEPAVLEHVVSETHDLLRADVTSCHRAVAVEVGMALDFFHCAGTSKPLLEAGFNGVLRREGSRVSAYNPLRPEPRQRNVVWLHRRSPRTYRMWREVPLVRDHYPRFGLAGLDELRVLVCDGPLLLGWFGGWRKQPFDAHDERILGAIASPLRTWLRWRERVGARDADAAALPVALEAIGLAAFILDRSGHVRHANAAGQRSLERGRRALLAELADAARTRRRTARFDVTAIQLAGARTPHLLCVERPVSGTDGRVTRAAAAWRLTSREAQVLRHVADGLSNRVIASWLGCAERTIEIHVTHILAKAGVENRTAVVARVFQA